MRTNTGRTNAGTAPYSETGPFHGANQSSGAAGEAALEFGRFHVLLRRRQLIADGVPVKLGTRALDLLLVLLEADGSLVTKDELLARVWPGITVSEENLKLQISALRKAFGEDRGFIRTEVGRGYRLTATVKSNNPWTPGHSPLRRRKRRSPQRTISHWMTTHCCPGGFDQSARQRAVPKTRLFKSLALAAGVGLSIFSYAAHAATASSTDTVQGLYDALLSTMKNGRTLGQSGRFTQLAPVIRRSFDVSAMARLSVGPSWTGLSDPQRQEMTESYGRYISALYADRFDSYDGQKLEVTGEQPGSSGVIVRSRIIKGNGEPVKVDYMMHRNGDDWLISDIYLDSAISEVATRRSEFAAILKTQGIDGLIAALNRKADMLTGTTARSF